MSLAGHRPRASYAVPVLLGSAALVVVLVAEQGLQPLRGVVAAGEDAALAAAVERRQLLLEVALQAGAVLALERAQVLDLAR